MFHTFKFELAPYLLERNMIKKKIKKNNVFYQKTVAPNCSSSGRKPACKATCLCTNVYTHVNMSVW